jgi:hypothetical protein
MGANMRLKLGEDYSIEDVKMGLYMYSLFATLMVASKLLG